MVSDGVPIKEKIDASANMRCVTVPAAVSIIEVPGNVGPENENPPEIAYQQDDSIQIHLYHQQIRQQYDPSTHPNASEQIRFNSPIPATSMGQLAGILFYKVCNS